MISDRPNPVSAELNRTFFFAELCSVELNDSAKVRSYWPKVFGRICWSRVNITIPPEIDDGITLWRGRHTSHLVSCHPIEVSIHIHKLT